VPAPLAGQGIHGPLAGDEGGEGHETLHNGQEHQQLFLQPFEEAKACFLVGCFEVSSPRTQLAVRFHELCVRPLDFRACRGLGLVHAAAQGVEPCLQLLGALAGETALRPRHFGLRSRSLRFSDGLIRLRPLLRQLAPDVRLLGLHGSHFLRQPAVFAFRSRLLLDSIRMLRPKTLDFGSHVRSQDTRRHTVGEVGRLTKAHETQTLMKTTNIEVQHNILALVAASAAASAAATPPSAAGTWSPPRPWRQRLTESRRSRRKRPTGLARHPSPQPPPLATWLPPKAGQQPIAPHPTLQHITGQRTSKKNLPTK
jgi:hypothetical protein